MSPGHWEIKSTCVRTCVFIVFVQQNANAGEHENNAYSDILTLSNPAIQIVKVGICQAICVLWSARGAKQKEKPPEAINTKNGVKIRGILAAKLIRIIESMRI